MKQGYTLLEVLVVISIIGILSLVALPNYKKYTGRAKLMDLLKITEKYKSKSVYIYDLNSSFPIDGSRIIPDATLVGDEYILVADFGNDIDQVAYRQIDADNAYIRARFNTTTAARTYQGISLYYGMRYVNDKIEFACGDWSNGFQANLVRDELPVKCSTDIQTFLGA